MAEARQQAEDSYRRVEIQAGSEADCGQQREQFSRRDLQDVEHSRGKTLSAIWWGGVQTRAVPAGLV